MYTKGFSINYTPLSVTLTLSVASTVPEKQVYNAYNKEYIPDYTLAPCIIRPEVRRVDKDGILPDGNINASLTNITWKEVQTDGTSTVITSSTPDYAITSSGVYNGTLYVKKNFTPGSPVTLAFSAEYVDPRTKQVFELRDSILLTCDTAAVGLPTLTLDLDNGHMYNPLVDAADVPVKARLYDDTGEVDASNRTFSWEVSVDDGTSYHTFGSDILDFFAELSSDTTTVTVHQDMMGDGIILRCTARYSVTGTPAASDAIVQTERVSLARRIPSYEPVFTGTPSDIPASNTVVYLDLVLQMGRKVISAFSEVFQVLWYSCTQNSAGDAVPVKQVGYGTPCTIPADFVSEDTLGIVGWDLVDMGGWGPLVDSDGAVFVDDTGAVLLFL